MDNRCHEGALAPYNNAKATYVLSSGGTNWRPWEAHEKGMHKKFMGNATKAAREVIAEKGNAGTKTNPGPIGPSLAKTLATAAGQIGYVNSKGTKFWQAVRPALNGQPWCGAFTYWVLKTNGIDLIKMGCSNPFYVPTIVSWAQRSGRWTQTPKPGYLVCFNWDKTGLPQHVEIVERVFSKKDVTCIGGNTTSNARGSQNNGGGVWRNRRTSGILGYVKIDYDPRADAGSRDGVDSLPNPGPNEPPKVVAETGLWDDKTAVALAKHAGMPMPITSTKNFWMFLEDWMQFPPRFINGALDLETVSAIQWRTNQEVIDGAWNSRTIRGIQVYLNKEVEHALIQ